MSHDIQQVDEERRPGYVLVTCECGKQSGGLTRHIAMERHTAHVAIEDARQALKGDTK